MADLNISPEQIAADLSLPRTSRFEGAADSAVTQIASVLFEAARDRANLSEGTLAPLLRALSANSAGTAAGFQYVWAPAAADCVALLNNEDDPAGSEPVFVQILANALANGFPGRGTIALSAPSQIVWRNLILPAVAELRFDCADSGRTVTVRAQECLQSSYDLKERTSGEWFASDGAVIELPAVDGADMVLLDQRHTRFVPAWSFGFAVVDTVTTEDVKQIQGALHMLGAVNPLYERWVTKVCRYLQMIESPDGGLHSGSAKWSWGNIAISRLGEDVRGVCSTCEMLIHECSHQYFHLVESLGKLTLDTGEYYSPFPREMRPLGAILLGAHACVNVLAFYREALAIYPELEDWLAGQIRLILPEVEQVRHLIGDRNKFTPMGQEFVSPLLAKLDDVTH